MSLGISVLSSVLHIEHNMGLHFGTHRIKETKLTVASTEAVNDTESTETVAKSQCQVSSEGRC